MTAWTEFPGAPAPGAMLLASDELAEGAVKQVFLGEKPARFAAVVTRVDGLARAYVNFCPHFRIPLAVEGRDLTTSAGLIWCSFHSAQFRCQDGHCVDGPVKGASLSPIPVIERDGAIFIASEAGDIRP